jgi:hypothetical protein
LVEHRSALSRRATDSARLLAPPLSVALLAAERAKQQR